MAQATPITIPTEPIGSVPRPLDLIERVARSGGNDPDLTLVYEKAIRETIEQLEATGSPAVTDGEQRKYHNFASYPVEGLPNTAPDGFKIPFSDGHTRRLPRLTAGPFRYGRYADAFLDVALRYAHVPVKQAVISPSALSLMYPAQNLQNYSREQFIEDLVGEHETEIRRCLKKGAHKVQVDFTEGRLAVKLDPSGNLLNSFIDLNNLALSRFSLEERKRIGVHTCPGNDFDSTHSADVDYSELLPSRASLGAGGRDLQCVFHHQVSRHRHGAADQPLHRRSPRRTPAGRRQPFAGCELLLHPAHQNRRPRLTPPRFPRPAQCPPPGG